MYQFDDAENAVDPRRMGLIDVKPTGPDAIADQRKLCSTCKFYECDGYGAGYCFKWHRKKTWQEGCDLWEVDKNFVLQTTRQ